MNRPRLPTKIVTYKPTITIHLHSTPKHKAATLYSNQNISHNTPPKYTLKNHHPNKHQNYYTPPQPAQSPPTYKAYIDTFVFASATLAFTISIIYTYTLSPTPPNSAPTSSSPFNASHFTLKSLAPHFTNKISTWLCTSLPPGLPLSRELLARERPRLVGVFLSDAEDIRELREPRRLGPPWGESTE